MSRSKVKPFFARPLNFWLAARSYSLRHDVTASSQYEALGLTPKASQAQIKAAYYRLSKVYHPDVNKGEHAKLKFLQITEAYEVLGNERTRRLYDRGMLHRGDHTTETEDYTAPFRARENTGKHRKPPPTGRTNIYNFDEFYRQHYRMSQDRKKASDDFEYRFYHLDKELDRERFAMMYGAGFAAVIALGLYLLYRYKRPPLTAEQKRESIRR